MNVSEFISYPGSYRSKGKYVIMMEAGQEKAPLLASKEA